MRRFAWYGRLSTKDKQDPTISFPSQRSECAREGRGAGRADRLRLHRPGGWAARRSGRLERAGSGGQGARRAALRRGDRLLDLAAQPRAVPRARLRARACAGRRRGLLRPQRGRPDQPRGAADPPHVPGARPVRGREAGPRGAARADREHEAGLPQRRPGALRLPAAARAAPRFATSPCRGHEVAARPRPRAGASDRRDVPALPRRLGLQGDRRPPQPAGRPSLAAPRRFQAQHLGQVVQEHDPLDPRKPRLHRAPLLEPARLPRRQAGRGAAGPAQPRGLDRGRAAPRGARLRGGLRAGPQRR